jgi:hypothetical protein
MSIRFSKLLRKNYSWLIHFYYSPLLHYYISAKLFINFHNNGISFKLNKSFMYKDYIVILWY